MTDRDDRRIVESSYRESPAGRPSFGMEVLVPTFIFTGASYVMVSIAFADEELAKLCAATVCALSLLVLLKLWREDGRPVNIVEHQRYVDDPQPRERPFVTSSDAQRIKVGKWNFTENEWRALGTVLATGRVSRSALADLEADDGEKLFQNITASYPGIVRELQRLGWVDQNNETTDVARHWYGGRGIPFRPTEDGAA